MGDVIRFRSEDFDDDAETSHWRKLAAKARLKFEREHPGKAWATLSIAERFVLVTAVKMMTP